MECFADSTRGEALSDTMRGQLTAYGVSNYDMLEDGETVVY